MQQKRGKFLFFKSSGKLGQGIFLLVSQDIGTTKPRELFPVRVAENSLLPLFNQSLLDKYRQGLGRAAVGLMQLTGRNDTLRLSISKEVQEIKGLEVRKLERGDQPGYEMSAKVCNRIFGGIMMKGEIKDFRGQQGLRATIAEFVFLLCRITEENISDFNQPLFLPGFNQAARTLACPCLLKDRRPENPFFKKRGQPFRWPYLRVL